MRRVVAAGLAVLLLCPVVAMGAESRRDVSRPGGYCVDPFTSAARRHGVSPYLLAAIAEVESGKDAWALNVDGRPVRPASRMAAVRFALEAERNADVGLMQVSLRHWKKELGLNVYRLLDPFANAETGARILARLWEAHGSILEGLARYHSGNKAKGAEYAERVVRIWHRRPDLVVCLD